MAVHSNIKGTRVNEDAARVWKQTDSSIVMSSQKPQDQFPPRRPTSNRRGEEPCRLHCGDSASCNKAKAKRTL